MKIAGSHSPLEHPAYQSQSVKAKPMRSKKGDSDKVLGAADTRVEDQNFIKFVAVKRAAEDYFFGVEKLLHPLEESAMPLDECVMLVDTSNPYCMKIDCHVGILRPFHSSA